MQRHTTTRYADLRRDVRIKMLRLNSFSKLGL
jgi:hypothetical protein